MAQLGDLALKTYPSSPVGSGSAATATVWSAAPLLLTRRPLMVSRSVSRGAPRPISTSGQYGTQSTYSPSSSVRNRLRLWPPLNRTGSPSRQLDAPTRGRALAPGSVPVSVMRSLLPRDNNGHRHRAVHP